MRTPKLYIRGMKDPKDISYNEGKKIEELLCDVMVDFETPIVIEGVWAGKKKDVKFIDWISDTNSNFKEKLEISKEDFDEITSQIKEAEEIAEKKGFKGHYKAFWFEIKDVARIEINKKSFCDEYYYTILVKDPVGYSKAQDLFDVYEKKLNTINFAKKKEYEYLENIAKQL